MEERRAERRAERLVRWYPGDWRARYGDELVALLVAEMTEQPVSWRRTLNVAANGCLARLRAAGLAGDLLAPAAQARAGLASFGLAAGVFGVFGVAMWSQLTIGWQWSEPGTPDTVAAMVVMTGAVAVLGVLGLLAATPVAVALVRRTARRQVRPLVVPVLLVLVGGATVVAGAHHFGNGWPGTRGHPWAHQGIVPGGVGAFSWASTLSVSSYWAHPAELRAFPPLEVVWMAVSPVAIAAVLAGAAAVVRRLHLSPAELRYEARLARCGCAVMAFFLAGGCLWVLRGGPGPRDLFHTGAIDLFGLLVMVGCLAVALRAARRAQPPRASVAR